MRQIEDTYKNIIYIDDNLRMKRMVFEMLLDWYERRDTHIAEIVA